MERRQLLSAVNWISAVSGNWDSGANWSTGRPPGQGDTAVIDTAANATITIQSGDNIQVQDITTGTNDTLSITGGSLTVTAASSTLSGPLSMTGGSLTASGSGVNLTANGSTTVSAASLYAEGGANLSLPQLTSYAGGVGYTDTLQATGVGSKLSLPALATIAGETSNYYSWTQVEALAGGDVEVPVLTTISGGPVQLEADGAGSELNVPVLSGFQGIGGRANASSLQITNSGTVLDPDLSQINGVSLIGDSTGTFTISPSLGFSISGGTSTVQAGTLVDQGSLSVQTGAMLNIEGALTVNGSGILSSVPGSTIEVSGNFLGTTQNADDFNPQGTVSLDSGTGTSKPPQLLEAMSADLGARFKQDSTTTSPTARSACPATPRSSWWTSRTTPAARAPRRSMPMS